MEDIKRNSQALYLNDVWLELTQRYALCWRSYNELNTVDLENHYQMRIHMQNSTKSKREEWSK